MSMEYFLYIKYIFFYIFFFVFICIYNLIIEILMNLKLMSNSFLNYTH